MFSLIALLTVSGLPFTWNGAPICAGVANAANPMVELISGGDVTGNGSDATTLHIVAFNADGSPMSGATLKVSTQGGSVGRVTMVKPGLYSAEWVAPNVNATTSVQVTVKGKAPDRTALQQSWAITVHPAPDQSVQMEANPRELTLGRDSSATL